MAQDRPTQAELLAAVADFLRDEAVPALDKTAPGLAFQLRQFLADHRVVQALAEAFLYLKHNPAFVQLLRFLPTANGGHPQ